MTALANNSIEVHSLPSPPKSKSEKTQGPVEANRLHLLDLQGHRTDVRSLSLSSNDELLASASNGEETEFHPVITVLRPSASCRITQGLERQDYCLSSYNGVWVRYM